MESYGLTPEMELVVLRLVAVDSEFYERVGKHLDPQRFAHPQSKMVIGAVRLVLYETKRHPASSLAVVQRVNRLHVEGKIKAEAVAAVGQVFDDADDLERVDREVVIGQLVPVVRRIMHAEAVDKAHDEFAKKGDFGAVTEMLATAKGLGEKKKSAEGLEFAHGSLSAFDAEPPEKLRTGILELDVGLNGGMALRSLGLVIADSGGGKSIFLASQAAEGVRLGLHVVMATLELSKLQQLARVTANYTGFPTEDIAGDPRVRKQAEVMLANTVAQRGPLWVEEYDPGVTTWEDLLQLVEWREQEVGRKVDLLVVDYVDKMGIRNRQARDGEYEAMKVVCEGLRDGIARPRGMWVWTASQPRRRDAKEMKRVLDTGDAADSIHKIRVCDLCITLNPLTPDNFEEIDVFVAKNRGSKSRFKVGPVFGDHARGRITTQTLP